MDETTLTRTLRDLATGASLHTAPAADARLRARGLQNRHRVTAVAAVVVVAVGAFGVRDLAGGSNRTPTATAPAHVLTVRPVTAEAKCDPSLPAGTRGTPDASGTLCYALASTTLTLHPRAAQALYDNPVGWSVQVSLDEVDRLAFGTLTTSLVTLPEPRNKLAIVLDGVVLEAPSIQQAIDGGTFVINGDPDKPYSQADADKLAAELRE